MADFNDKQIEILEVAEQLFAEKGFDGTSVGDIAKNATINVAMVSYDFGSKEKLLEALVVYRIADMRLQLENLFQEVITPIQKMEKLVALYIHRITKNRCMYQILYFELSSKKRELNFEAFAKLKTNNLKVMQSIASEGQAAGLFQSDVNVTLLPTTIIGSFLHFQMNMSYYQELLHLKNDAAFEHYVLNDLTVHIQKTIKSLLLYEK
jgi:AcrR family transcriptional regulator